MMKISIVIPTYECYGKGWLYLNELLNSIYKQDFKDFEVVISDQSTDDSIRDMVAFYQKMLPITLLDSRSLQRSISCNVNNAIRNCRGKYIKPMFMDDFFCNDKALSIINEHLDSNPNFWCANATRHCESINFLEKHALVPSYNDNIHRGSNSMSGPSVITFKNKVYFDENLTLLMDCEMYKRMRIQYGMPLIIKEALSCNRHHRHQAQFEFSHLHSKELEYVQKLYG